MEMVGRILLGLLGFALTAAFPASELARGMADDTSARPSRVAGGLSLAGVALLLTAVLAGCAHTPPPSPAVEVRYQTITREVQRPCPVTVPTRPGPLTIPLGAALEQALAITAAKLREYSGPGQYADRAGAAIRTCTTPSPAP